MELSAAYEAVRSIEGPVHVVSDSTYVVNCFKDNWWRGWLKRGWKNSQKKPVANRDLWEPLIELYQVRDVTFEWVKGHSGDEWNDVADRLCVAAAQQQRDLSGTGMPDDLGEADTNSRPTAAAQAVPMSPETKSSGADPTGQQAPEGHLLAVVGHRPPEIGGYGENPTATAVRRQLGDVIAAKAQMFPNLVVLTGLGLGAEQLGAEAARDLDVPYIGVLAFPDPSAVWPRAAQKHFDQLLDDALDIIVLQNEVPETKQQVGGALKRRDAWLARNSNEALVVWDRSSGGVGQLVRALEASLGEGVWVIDPAEL